VSSVDVPDYAELMGNDEVDTKGDPVKGRRYFFYNLIMIIVLSLWVLWNSDFRKSYYPDKNDTGSTKAPAGKAK